MAESAPSTAPVIVDRQPLEWFASPTVKKYDGKAQFDPDLGWYTKAPTFDGRDAPLFAEQNDILIALISAISLVMDNCLECGAHKSFDAMVPIAWQTCNVCGAHRKTIFVYAG